MSVIVYALAGGSVFFAACLLRASSLQQAFRALCGVATALWLIMLMLDAHTAAMAQVIVYGFGVLFTSYVMLSLMQTKLSNLTSAGDILDNPKLGKKRWLMPTIFSLVLLSVFVFFISQTTGKFPVNELTPRIVAKTVWQTFTPVLVVMMFMAVVGVMLLMQMLTETEAHTDESNEVQPSSASAKEGDL